jgi:sn-glycerol 3-phosphate transport system ATP-binding protein
MGRAIVREPEVFLFDEPLSNLDAKLRVQMRIEIKRLQRRLGITSVYVTHDQVEAMTMADRLVVMNGGIAEQTGSPIEVYETPASTFVATFIGSPSMNLLDGEVSSDGASLLIAGTPLALPAPRPQLAGKPVTAGIRPEHLKAVDAGQGLNLTLDLVEHLGADTLLHGHLSGAEKHLITMRVEGHFTGKPDSLTVGPADATHLHLFDKQSGLRL